MKKLLIILLLCFIVTGCNNVVSFDFNDEIDTKIELSFTVSDFKKYTNNKSDDIKDSIDAMIGDANPIVDSYDVSFIQKSFKKVNDNYSGEFEYTYTYDNFKDNAIFVRCFETAVIDEDDKKIYVYLKGNSICAPFQLVVTSDGRLLNNNASKREIIFNYCYKDCGEISPTIIK